jgi:hypothetical protein
MSATSWRANHITSAARAVGGKLLVDGDTIAFRPHRFDAALAAHPWSAPLAEIVVSVAPRKPLSHAFGAGLRRQLCLTAGGEEHYFIINRVDRVAEEIEALVTARGSAAG